MGLFAKKPANNVAKAWWQTLWPNMTYVPDTGFHGVAVDTQGIEGIGRGKTGIDYFPVFANNGVFKEAGNFAYLGDIPALQGQNNEWVWAQMYGELPTGPIMNPLPASINSNINIPALQKVGSV
jgi:hypothetical protein